MVTTDIPLTIDARRNRGSESPSLVATFNEDFLLDLVEVLADTQEYMVLLSNAILRKISLGAFSRRGSTTNASSAVESERERRREGSSSAVESERERRHEGSSSAVESERERRSEGSSGGVDDMVGASSGRKTAVEVGPIENEKRVGGGRRWRQN
ncbi:hypothetical protein LINPERPRIM_LOCUS11469 [Linum perenne]